MSVSFALGMQDQLWTQQAASKFLLYGEPNAVDQLVISGLTVESDELPHWGLQGSQGHFVGRLGRRTRTTITMSDRYATSYATVSLVTAVMGTSQPSQLRITVSIMSMAPHGR